MRRFCAIFVFFIVIFFESNCKKTDSDKKISAPAVQTKKLTDVPSEFSNASLNGSIMVPANSVVPYNSCIEYRGISAELEKNLKSQVDSTFERAPCVTDRAIGACHDDENKNSITFYFRKKSDSLTVTFDPKICEDAQYIAIKGQ